MNQLIPFLEWMFYSMSNFWKVIVFMIIVWFWIATMLSLVVDNFKIKLVHYHEIEARRGVDSK